jgi:protein-S-isoprenylcysteine O-methyltransferase Ste14
MIAGHLFFAMMKTAYIMVAIQFEECDLVRAYGEGYRKYREQVSMPLPTAAAKERTSAISPTQF